LPEVDNFLLPVAKRARGGREFEVGTQLEDGKNPNIFANPTFF